VEERIRVAVLAGKTDEVIALLEGEIDQNPTDKNLRQRLAIAYAAAKRYDAALGLYEELLFDDPNSADLLFKAAEMNRRLGKLDKALELFERAASADPFRTDASLQQALLLDGTGQRDLAKPVYERILEVKPDHPIAANNLAYLLVEEGGDLKRALDLAQAAHKQLPQSADIADTLGVVYLKNGRAADAVAAFHAAMDQKFDSAMVRSHLMEALETVTPPTPEMQELRVLLRGPVTSRSEARISLLVNSLPVLE
jgi:tetratricopeptide (TPR) repeat protein